MQGSELAELYDAYGAMVYRTAYTYCRRREDAEDVTQEVFESCARSLRFRGTPEQLKAWFLRAAVTRSLNLLGSSNVSRRAELDEELAAEPPAEETGLDVYDAVLALPASFRRAVFLYYYQQLPISEIAKLTGCTENLVRVRLHRARDLLREKLKGDYDYEI